MADILHDLFIAAPPAVVFDAISTPAGLDAWWTLRSEGTPREGSEYTFYFGPQHDWRGRVLAFIPGAEIAWGITRADQDWTGTVLLLSLAAEGGGTRVRFAHRAWPEANQHFRVSSYCWATYLRLLRRYVEFGEVVPYAERDVA